MVPVMLPVSALFELKISVAVQVFAEHVSALKVPDVLHVAVPPPEYPALHITVRVWPVVPLMLPAAALLELATSVGVQVFAVQVGMLAHEAVSAP